jgi:hypothetical protein
MVRALGERPGMLLPEQSYGALVAYIEGYVAGSGSDELAGFKDWVAAELLGRESSFHWSAVVAVAQNEHVGDAGFSVLSVEESDRASRELIALMQRFLGEGAAVSR